jgi:integrase
MPKMRGVYRDGAGGWYFKASTHKDPITGKWRQVTRRGFATATDAARARSELLASLHTEPVAPVTGLTVRQLVEQYLEDCEATGKLSPKTMFDYRHYLDDYIQPWLGDKLVRDVTPETVASWQRHLATSGSTKSGRGLSPNSIRLARSPLSGAFKHAVRCGIVASNPVASISPPRPRRSIPRHWSPEQAREFLALTEGDRLWCLWAFLLGSGLRIGELVFLRWSNVDLDAGLVRVNEFATVLGYDVVSSTGKSYEAVRTVDIDDHLANVLRRQRVQQAQEQLASADFEVSNFVFTKPDGGHYHPMWLSRLLGRITAEIGLPRLTAHGLRHTSATLMLARGVPPKVAAERLGHADAMLFMNLYSHVTPTMQREAASEIGSALFGEQ